MCRLRRPALRPTDSKDATKFRFCPAPTLGPSLTSALTSVQGDVSETWFPDGLPSACSEWLHGAQLSPPVHGLEVLIKWKLLSRDSRGDIEFFHLGSFGHFNRDLLAKWERELNIRG